MKHKKLNVAAYFVGFVLILFISLLISTFIAWGWGSDGTDLVSILFVVGILILSLGIYHESMRP